MECLYSGRATAKAEKVRHASDYDDFYIASREETEKQIEMARNMIDLVVNWCQTK